MAETTSNNLADRGVWAIETSIKELQTIISRDVHWSKDEISKIEERFVECKTLFQNAISYQKTQDKKLQASMEKLIEKLNKELLPKKLIFEDREHPYFLNAALQVIDELLGAISNEFASAQTFLEVPEQIPVLLDETVAIWKAISKKSTSEVTTQTKSGLNQLLQRYPEFEKEKKDEIERLLSNPNKESTTFKIWVEDK